MPLSFQTVGCGLREIIFYIAFLLKLDILALVHWGDYPPTASSHDGLADFPLK